MSWEMLLKADFLPKRKTKRWIQIIETQQATDEFIRKIQSGDYQTKGMKATLDFVEGDNFDNLLGDIFSEGIDEDDAEARYETVRVVLRAALKEKSKSVKQTRLVDADSFLSTIDEVARAIRGNKRKKIGALLKAAEIFARNHPQIVRRVKGDMRREHGSTLIPFLNQHDEITNPGANAQKLQDLTGLKPLSQQEQERTDRAFSRLEQSREKEALTSLVSGDDYETLQGKVKGVKGKAPSTKAVSYEYILLGIFAAMGRTKGKPMKEKSLRRLSQLTVNPITPQEAERYFKTVCLLHRSLVPDEFLDRELITGTKKKYRLNPYLKIILEERTLGEANDNLNTTLADAVGGDTDNLERLLQHHNRIYPDEFVEWIKTIDFEGKKIAQEIKEKREDSEEEVVDVIYGKNNYSDDDQSRLKRLSDTHFKEVGTGYSRLDTSQDMADIVEQVWTDLINSKLDEIIPGVFDMERIIDRLRESKGDFNTVMEEYTEEPPTETFGRNSKELLDVLVAGGEAVGLNLGEPNRDAFVELFDGLKSNLIASVESKLQDIVNNPPKYIGFSVGRKRSDEQKKEIADKLKVRPSEIGDKENIYEMLQREGYLS